MKRTLLIITLIFLTVFSSCKKEEICVRCANSVDSVFVDTYFQFLLNSNLDSALVQYDTVNNTSVTYELCSTEKLKNVELTKIVSASGNFKHPCNDATSTFIELTDLKVVDSCLPNIVQIEGDFSLNNDWLVYYIQTTDTLVYPPCEGYSEIFFDTENNALGGTLSYNWFYGNYVDIDAMSIQMPEGFYLSLGIGTQSQTYFENKLLEILGSNAVITYSIEKNFLILENKAINSIIKLYLKP